MEFKDYFCDTPDGWIMHQILLDNMALGEGVPLRIIKLDQLERLYELFLESDKENKFKKLFQNKKNFDAFTYEVSEWFLNKISKKNKNKNIFDKFELLTRLYEEFSQKIFPVLPASLHSLEFLAQTMVKCWRIYTLLWLYQHLILIKRVSSKSKSSDSLKDVYGLDHYCLHYQCVKMKKGDGDCNNVLLLAGPVFGVSFDMLTNETGVDEKVTEKVEVLLKRFTQRNPEENRNSSSYFSQAIHLETVRLNKFLVERFINVNGIWNLLYDAHIEGDTKISHKWLRMLTVWAQYINNMTKEEDPDPSLNTSIWLVSDGLSDQKKTNLGVGGRKLSVTIQGKKWLLSMEACTFVENKNTDQMREFYDLYTRLERKTKQLEKNRLIVMDLWLESYFSALLSEMYEEKRRVTDVSYSLAGWVCAAMRADIAELHSYYPQRTNQSLEVHDIYLREKKYRKFSKKIIEALQGLTEDEQRESNIYKVLKQGDKEVCLSQNPPCPTKTSLLSLMVINPEWPGEKAEIVVPIKFNGRVLGAIEVASFSPWRFRWGQRTFLLNIATSLGAYWYQQRHLECLSKIQRKVLEFDQEGCEKGELYDAICEQAAVLFLCRGAGLWIRDKNNADLFVRQGWHAIKVDKDKLSVSKKDSLISLLVREVAKTNDFYPEVVGSSSKLNDTNKKYLQDGGIQHLAYIPIRTQSDNENNEVIAVLALYDHSEQGFDKSWRYIAQFFSGHLHVVIDSVANAIKERESIKKMMLHQVTDSASHLADKASKIALPLIHQVNALTKIHAVLSVPGVQKRLDMAKFIGELPDDLNVTDDLNSVIVQFNSRSAQPLKDVNYWAKKLRNQIGTFSADFKRDQENIIKNKYKVRKEKIPTLLQKARNISSKTDDDFLRFIHRECLLDAQLGHFNLRALVTEVSTSGGYVPLDFSGVDYSIILNINRDALMIVLTNLWVNARKYRINKSETIIWNTVFKKNGACVLQISNPSQLYSEAELDKLVDKGYRHSFWKKPGKKQSVTEGQDAGLGLYLVDNLCRHILNISFEIKQVPRKENRSEFVCELQFNTNSIIKR